jgi:hypothetical protein
MRSRLWIAAGVVVVSAMLLPSRVALAGDIESAKRHLEKAKEELKAENWNSLEDELKATEDLLDGVPDADKAPILKDVEALKKEGLPKIAAMRSKRIVERATSEIEGAADSASGNPDSALSQIKRASEMLASDDAKKYIDADTMKKLQSRIAGVQQLAIKGVKKRIADNAKPLIDELDKQVADNPFKGKEGYEANNIAQSIDSAIKRIRGIYEPLPADDADVKAVNAKLDAIAKKVDAYGADSEKAGVADRVAKYWSDTKHYFEGWEAETAGPNWERYTKEGSQGMSDLLMPKTVEAINRTKYWFDSEEVKKAQSTYPDDPKIKGTVAEAQKTLDTALAKMNDNYNKLLEEAEKLPTPSKNDLSFNKPGYMDNDAKRWFGGTKYEAPNIERAKKLKEKWEGATAANQKAKEDAFKDLVKQADAAWPGIRSGIQAESGFNPSEADKWKGKTIELKGVRNRAGWDYSGYDFAMAINGIPLGGNYAPNVNEAFKAVFEKTSSGPDDHTDWDVIAVVEGPGKISERTSADVRDGSTTIGKIEGKRSVDCVVLKIVGLHAGPIAIGPGMSGTAGAGGGGTAAASMAGGGGASTGVMGWMWRILSCLILLGGAALAFLKARPSAIPAAAAAPAADGTATVPVSPVAGLTSGDTSNMIGLVLIALGVLTLLFGLIIGDLLPALAFIAAGAFLAAEFLRGKGILKGGLYDQVRGLGVPIAAAAAAIAVLHLFLGGHWLF